MTPQGSDVILERMMALHPKVMDLTLDRIWRLLMALNNPQDRLPPVIHLAGTNGKGSTQAMIRAGLEGAKKKVHAYTSPHLARFHERIRLAGDLIAEPHLVEMLDACYAANDEQFITYFEITTCAAFLAFAQTDADYTLLEVGLGGRLDATNVVAKPAACVITPVDLDHQQYLGETLGEIAFEKAGILKRDVPAIIAPQKSEAMDAIEAQAAKVGAPIIAHGQHWHVATEHGRLVYQDETGLLDLPLPSLPGPHQIQNAGTALATLRHLKMPEPAYEACVTNTYWPARMQRLNKGAIAAQFPSAEIWLDGGHNPAAGKALAATLAQLPQRETHLICGMIETKDVAGFLAPIATQSATLTAITIPGEPNAVPSGKLAAAASDLGLVAGQTDDLIEAISEILATSPAARIVICGSLYLAGHVLRENS